MKFKPGPTISNNGQRAEEKQSFLLLVFSSSATLGLWSILYFQA